MRRVFLGKDLTGAFAFRVSKPGKDVFSSNPDDFLLTEQAYATLPVMRGSFNTLPYAYFDSSFNFSYYRLQIFHGLGYVPVVLMTSLFGTVAIDPNYITIDFGPTITSDHTSPYVLPGTVTYVVFATQVA